MGESIVGFPKDADKMGEIAGTDSSNPSLEVSVSFGRFENDSLSWEKWSAFSPNKYLEEVEKCATPGSVAQKRAYFEAHYKRIAARKAEELLEQEKQMQDDDPLKSDDQNNGDQICCGTDYGIDVATSQTSAQANSQEPNIENGMSSTHVEDLKEEDDEDVFTMECQTSSIEGREIEETDSGVVSPKTPKLNRPEELVLVKEVETITADTQETIQPVPKTLDSDTGNAPEVKEEKARFDLQKRSQKVTPVSKERTVAKAKKKSISPMTKTPQNPTPRVSKLPQNSTPRVSKIPQNTTPRVSKILQNTTPSVSKPISAPTGAKSAPRSSVTKANGSSLTRSTNQSSEKTKKVPPKSLHMSLSFNPKKSDSASETVVTARKSLIMEQMGDKDIVKRAFKTFQNSVNQLKSSNEEKPSAPMQLPTKSKEPKVSTPMPLPKDTGGSLKTSYPDKRNAKAAPSSFGLRSEERAEKRKELTINLAKPNARDAERAHFQPKSKEQKEAEIKKLRQSLKFKATPTPDSYRGQKLLKSTLEKEGPKKETLR
ncbi:hypothetical protein RchiOBHm_Chr4g0444851 [Rosa chinensis]|uniref:TPX2 C-terminal domain-containing protein n=1 Tax=Rosa chinensis TaxID=74649 RepID=A0A2P6R4B5_ROSCH|nr:protein WVD2-like 7 [Rosa chinensis]XP_024192695.1 protein WVD2-like 7 [Rosa chinensis]XP_024192698.1 protein WVD2-like 7 [Rosa chinensis]PRQ41248.1 hypothetical protein RchiOBHm_Chr4g0444851 [Rosa chinensis]